MVYVLSLPCGFRYAYFLTASCCVRVLSGDPNVGPSRVSVPWSSINDNSDAEMMFSTAGNAVEQSYRAKFCDAWDHFGYDF